MDITVPHQSTAVIGHELAKKQLLEAYDSGRMHHAWLFVGPSGIGKATLAYHVAHMILSGGENRFGRFNPEHAAARLIAAESHPDLFVLRKETDEKTGAVKDVIAVDEARKISPFLSLTSSYGKGRVVIIDEAHALNRNGQNALLKSIEEPPTGATVMMTATTVGALLPTIRSRCRVLELEPLPQSDLEVVLARLGVDLPEGSARGRFLELAQGSVSRALQLTQGETLALFDEALNVLRGLPSIDILNLHKLADRLSGKADIETYRFVTDLIGEALRQSIKAVSVGDADNLGFASKLAARGRLDKAFTLWENTCRSFASADAASLDRKLVFINAISELSRETA